MRCGIAPALLRVNLIRATYWFYTQFSRPLTNANCIYIPYLAHIASNLRIKISGNALSLTSPKITRRKGLVAVAAVTGGCEPAGIGLAATTMADLIAASRFGLYWLVA